MQQSNLGGKKKTMPHNSTNFLCKALQENNFLKENECDPVMKT
jgi:hypothetical protein